MKKTLSLFATVLLTSGLAHAESGSGTGTITVPLNVSVGNVCTWWDQPGTDIAGRNFTQTDRSDGTPIFLGTYYATKDLVGAAQLKIKCTKDTAVKRSFPQTVKLTRAGSNDYLQVDVSEKFTLNESKGGDADHTVADQHISDMTFTVKAGQWGVSKGSYSGNFVMTYDYQ
ncbi:hypothetical protein D3875_01470 [Deinococcus cavernae]|uniref:DUF4402 domain-containing protein n=1 Tax=Deinococcus cavernae TaxID=2320857 RepID=A0A418VGP7_9DEIO|nr:hypothetical protein [Deinococcus cavernae]RJF75212.1 hypothetical protein D3875_01470 [Deinococcus cavernae]